MDAVNYIFLRNQHRVAGGDFDTRAVRDAMDFKSVPLASSFITFIASAPTRPQFFNLTGTSLVDGKYQPDADVAWNSPDGNVVGTRRAGDDFNLDPANASPGGIAVNADGFWVADHGADKVFAYNLDATRCAGDDFNLDPANPVPTGIAVNADGFWVGDGFANKVFAYNHDGTRRAGDDFNLDPANANLGGITVNADGFWVGDLIANKVFAYNHDGTRRAGDDFNLDPANASLGGIAVNADGFWVADHGADKVFAYNLDATRRAGDDFNLDPANAAPTGIAVNADGFWVADSRADKVFAYNPHQQVIDTLTDPLIHSIRMPCQFEIRPMTSKSAGRYMDGRRREIPLQETILEGRIRIRNGNEADIRTLQAVQKLGDVWMFASNVAMDNPKPLWIFDTPRIQHSLDVPGLGNFQFTLPDYMRHAIRIRNIRLQRYDHTNMTQPYGGAEIRFNAHWGNLRDYPS